MNEEEKKAIEIVKRLATYYDDYSLLDEEEIEENKNVNKSIELVLNLIEKLQKENEELKLYNNSITSQLEQMTTEKFKKGWIHQSEFKDFISVQKVKDKIEEYKNMLKTCNKAKDIDRIKAINERILELEELLEGRK